MANNILQEEWPEPRVVVLRFNRPTVLNVLNLEMRRALATAFSHLEDDDRARVIVIAGGERQFCAGADLSEYVNAEPIEIVQRHMDRLWEAISRCRKPVIAAVRGHALGGGCELAMHADIIIAGRNATFAQPEVLLGLIPGGGASQRLTRAVGKFRAMKLMLTGERFNAEQALQWGLVSELAADDQVDATAVMMAKTLASGPPLAQRFIKEAVLASMNSSLLTGLELERKSFQLLFATYAKREGIQARIDRRSAKF